MKKTLLAAALLTGFAGAASAQNSVTLYGVLDIGLQYVSVKNPSDFNFDLYPAGTTSSRLGMASGQQSGSRWGLRGVEDLGNGLRASFVYEAGVTATTGSFNGFSRVSTLGLSSAAWGSVNLGRDLAPGAKLVSGIDPFGAAFGTSQLDQSIGTNSIRYSNMIAYTTPSFSGFTAGVAYSFDTGLSAFGYNPTTDQVAPITNGKRLSTGATNRAVNVGVRYANGPVMLGATYDAIQVTGNGGLVNGARPSAYMLGGTYDLKVVKLHAAFGQTFDGIIEGQTGLSNFALTAGDQNTTGAVLAVDGLKTMAYMIGLSAPVGGSGNVFASWQQLIPQGIIKDEGKTQSVASIGYTYAMSNRTNLYGFYSYTNNTGMIEKANSNQVGVGVRHTF